MFRCALEQSIEWLGRGRRPFDAGNVGLFVPLGIGKVLPRPSWVELALFRQLEESDTQLEATFLRSTLVWMSPKKDLVQYLVLQVPPNPHAHRTAEAWPPACTFCGLEHGIWLPDERAHGLQGCAASCPRGPRA